MSRLDRESWEMDDYEHLLSLAKEMQEESEREYDEEGNLLPPIEVDPFSGSLSDYGLTQKDFI